MFAEHMIVKYNELWKNNHFTFRIPYQSFPQNSEFTNIMNSELIKSPKGIKQTVLKLIEDLNDNDWVYWCMDDRYPVKFDCKKIDALIPELNKTPMDGLSFASSMKDRSIRNSFLFKERISINGITYLRRKHYGTIWTHQFLRVKVLFDFFFNMPDKLTKAKEMDYYLIKKNLPKEFKLYSTTKSLCVFAESTSAGKIRKHCFESLQAKGFSVSERYELVDGYIIPNSDDRIRNKLLWRIKDIASNAFR